MTITTNKLEGLNQMTTVINPPIDFTHWAMRLTAYIIDSIMLAIVVGIIAFASNGGLVVIALGWVVLSGLYFIILDVYSGGTIGKRIVGLEVQLEKGGRISLTKSIIRNISKITIVLPIVGWLIAVITSGIDRRQKYLDRLAGTTVVQTRQIVQSTFPSAPPPPLS
jgi:uncharacterized RDD family membrane protein YckC